MSMLHSMSAIIATIAFTKMTKTGYTWKSRRVLLEEALGFSIGDMLFASHTESSKDSEHYPVLRNATRQWSVLQATTSKQNAESTRFQDDWRYFIEQKQDIFQTHESVSGQTEYQFADSTLDITWQSKTTTWLKLTKQELSPSLSSSYQDHEDSLTQSHAAIQSMDTQNEDYVDLESTEKVDEILDELLEDLEPAHVERIDTNSSRSRSPSHSKISSSSSSSGGIQKRRLSCIAPDSDDIDADGDTHSTTLRRDGRIFVEMKELNLFHLIGIVQRQNGAPPADRYFLLVESHEQRISRLAGHHSDDQFTGHRCSLFSYSSCLSAFPDLYCMLFSCVVMAKWFDPYVPVQVNLNPRNKSFRQFLEPFTAEGGSSKVSYPIDWETPLLVDIVQSYIFCRQYHSTQLSTETAPQLLETLMTQTCFLQRFVDTSDGVLELATRGELFKLHLLDYRDFGYDLGLDTILKADRTITNFDRQWDSWEQHNMQLQEKLAAGQCIIDEDTLSTAWSDEESCM